MSFLPAFRIGVSEVSAIPEPTSFALLGAGIVAAGLMRRRRTAVKEDQAA